MNEIRRFPFGIYIDDFGEYLSETGEYFDPNNEVDFDSTTDILDEFLYCVCE